MLANDPRWSDSSWATKVIVESVCLECSCLFDVLRPSPLTESTAPLRVFFLEDRIIENEKAWKMYANILLLCGQEFQIYTSYDTLSSNTFICKRCTNYQQEWKCFC